MWKHFGWDEKGRWGALPARLKAIGTRPYGKSWVLVYPDGWQVDTRYAASGKDHIRRDCMAKILEQAGIMIG